MKWRMKSAELKSNERRERARKHSIPYRWFAWYPVRLKEKTDNNYLQYVWLVHVWKRIQYDKYDSKMWTEYSLDCNLIKEDVL